MLENIVRAFLRGLNNQEIRKEAARGMTSADRSLRNVYALAGEARRTNLEIQKSLNEDTKPRELRFYKSHFELNVPKHQVAFLFASSVKLRKSLHKTLGSIVRSYQGSPRNNAPHTDLKPQHLRQL